MPTASISVAARWSIVIVALLATTCSFMFINGIAFVIPMLESKRSTNLAVAGLLSSMPSFGMVLTLYGWGALLDRIGERVVLALGMALTAAACYAAASFESLMAVGACLFVGGMAAASANTASGRLVTGFFPPEQRGLVMGIRQTAQPLGIALGAAVIPDLAEHGLRPPLMCLAVVCSVMAVACGIAVSDPPRRPRASAPQNELANPYRGSRTLWRIHISSALLMVPQATIATFMLVWLMGGHHWSAGTAGALVTVSQLLGAAARVVMGRISDRVGSRLRPMRVLAVLGSASMVVVALADHLHSQLAETAMVVAAVITVLDNGLASTAVAEIAGAYWSGRALGTQNTTQRLAAGLTPPLLGASIATFGYPLAYALCALFPLAALPLVPPDTHATKVPVGPQPESDGAPGAQA